MLSYNETKTLIGTVLETDADKIRSMLFKTLQLMNSSEGEFYESIAKHGLFMNLSSEQWLDLLTKLPNQIFWSQIAIDKILSEEQKKKLPSTTG